MNQPTAFQERVSAAAAASSAAVPDSRPAAAEQQLLQRQLLLDEQQLLQRRREQLDAFESLERDAADLQEIFTDLAAMTAVRSRRSALLRCGKCMSGVVLWTSQCNVQFAVLHLWSTLLIALCIKRNGHLLLPVPPVIGFGTTADC